VPELPEVEYIRRQLHRAMAGARIERVLARRPDLRYPFQPDFVARLEGQKVSAVRRRAKYLLVDLESGDVLMMHLGMSGSFSVARTKDAQPPTLHDHVVFGMSSGSTVVFNDPRRFGFMKIVEAGDVPGDVALAAIGPEPLSGGFTAAALARSLAKRKTSLKSALLDQRVVAGLGNIYVVEALHRARLSPKRRASTLVTKSGEARPPLHDVVDAIRVTLKDAIANSHRVDGEDRFRVYDREGQRCPRRGCSGVIRRIVQAGRSTFFCPVCQR
jgi:formamidopyrimidine-DNA glycosylase